MDIDKTLKRLISENLPVPFSVETINNETSFLVDLGMDSVSLVRLMINIEREFGIKFDEEDVDLPVIKNYGELKNYVVQYI